MNEFSYSSECKYELLPAPIRQKSLFNLKMFHRNCNRLIKVAQWLIHCKNFLDQTLYLEKESIHIYGVLHSF